MVIERLNLPFRKNCEGYFYDGKGNILTKENGNGILVFPGGGVNENETSEHAIIRETFEETGAVIKNVRKLGELKFIFGENWAQSEKQKNRYHHYQGEEMTFFTGEISTFGKVKIKEDDFWDGQKLLSIEKAIHIIKSGRPFDEEIKDYRETQLKFLREIQDKKIL